MNDVFKKIVFTGIGLAAVSKEKIEDSIKEMIAKGSVTEQEGRKFVEEMTGYSEKARIELEKQVNGYIEKAIDRMELVRKDDLQELHEAIAALQKGLEKEEQQ
jgi:polyhydroxyalkanoate synthesis regulator phasin